MTNSQRLLIISILTILLAAVVVSGCTSTTTSPAASTSASARPGTATPANNGPTGPPTVSTSGQTMTITGSQAGQFTMTMEKAKYLVSVKSATGNIGMTTPEMGTDTDLIPYDSASLESSGSYEQQMIHNWNTAGDNSFKITFAGSETGPYTIAWTKLPSGVAAVSPPQKYTGKGQKVLGPVKLNAGTATFTLSCPDAKQAGFNVQLFNADTGAGLGMVGYNAEGGSVTNSYSATKTQNIAAAGNYYIQVTANSAAAWEIDVSQ